jgi:flagellar biosynthetic protein FliO
MANDVSLVEVMARLVAAFALIIGMLGGGVYLFRRRGMIRVPGAVAPQKRMRVVERQSIARSSSVALVRVGDRSYLVGATDTSVSLLADVSDSVTAAEEADAHADDVAECCGDEEHVHAHQRTGAAAGRDALHPARMDLVGAILQRMTRRA